MRSLLLCRERLERFLLVLDRTGGTASIRDLTRTYRIYDWEVEQAAALGWVRISTRKPATGRPSRVAEKLSESDVAKLPPWRHQISKEITIRHWRFALESIGVETGPGPFGFKLSTLRLAYLKAFPNARSKAGASASASRLMKRADVQLMRQWLRSGIEGPMPNTVRGLAMRLLLSSLPKS